jgi:hypothetical protein
MNEEREINFYGPSGREMHLRKERKGNLFPFMGSE